MDKIEMLEKEVRKLNLINESFREQIKVLKNRIKELEYNNSGVVNPLANRYVGIDPGTDEGDFTRTMEVK